MIVRNLKALVGYSVGFSVGFSAVSYTLLLVVVFIVY